MLFFLSPSIRSTAIWPDSRLIGLFIFACSIYFFKISKKSKIQRLFISNLLLVLSAYFSPNFSVFLLYYFFYYIKILKVSHKIIIISLMNLLLSLPMLIYLCFLLDVNFLSIKVVSHLSALDGLNPSNKIFIISTLILFYMIPFVFNQFPIKLQFY